MNELCVTINGLGLWGGIVSITALFYWADPAWTINILRGIGELFGMKEKS